MSLRHQLLDTARRGPRFLADSTELVKAFYAAQFDSNGAVYDRAGRPDLYYATFALAGAQALEVPIPVERVTEWLSSFGDGDGLDFVHLGALARCWAAVGTEKMSSAIQNSLLDRLESFRKPDGGYDGDLSAQKGTAYGVFVALGAYQDLNQLPPRPLDLAKCLHGLQSQDGAWSNTPGQRIGALNATAGAVVLLQQLGLPVSSACGDWILAQEHAKGGFLAVPGAPVPDLLSTATALHALAAMDRRLPSEIQDRCLDFLDTLWSPKGGFHGNWADDAIDPEYTFYGLLVLGHLG